MKPAAARYAVYWVPARDHPLWAAGCDWLGRDPERSGAAPTPREATAAPRRYGFHATLKPPMHLRKSVQVDDFLAAVADLARDTPRFEMPPLAVATLSNFIALCPAVHLDPMHALRRLADRAVLTLDGWRAPPAQAELERRLAGLGDAEQALVRCFGYPHVLHFWRFHLTLSDALAGDAEGAARRIRLLDQAVAHFDAALRAPLFAEEVAVFAEPVPGRPLVLLRRFKLGQG